MPNDFYTRAYNPLPEQRVSSQVLKDEFARVEAGFDEVQGDANRAIKLPVGTADQTLAMDAVARANLVLAFDTSGNITAISYGRYRGDWVTGTAYVTSDYFRDPASKNIYSTVAAHTSGVLATDITAGRVQLAVNVADVEAAKTAAAASAELAAAQVALAAEQAALATRNGSAQVALAAEQADRATTQADAARAIVNFVGLWSTLTGPLNKPVTVYHNGSYYALLNNLANVSASEPGVSSDWVSAGGVQIIAYSDRGTLRSSAGAMAIIDGLGLFSFVGGSNEPDDDESCFATSTGRWLLQAAHWDLVAAWQLPEVEDRNDYDEDENLRLAAQAAAIFASKVLMGSASSTITSVGAVSQVSFTGAVAGAAVGDRVVATPPDAVGPSIAVYARVTAEHTVTVYLNNPSAAAQSIAAGTWSITVIKS